MAIAVAAVLLLSVPGWAGVRARYGGALRLLLREEPQTSDPARLRSPSDVALAGLVHATLWRALPPQSPRPELVASLQVPESGGGRLHRLALKPGLRFHDGTPLDGKALVASLERLAFARRSPFAALTFPLVGAADGTGRLAGLTAIGELEVQASLAFPYPDWPLGLAHPGAAIVAAGAEGGAVVGAGPFVPSSARPGELLAFADAAGGRPFVDRVQVVAVHRREAARALSGGATLAAMPVPGKPAGEGPCSFATYVAFNEGRLKGRGGDVRAVLEAALDRGELTRLFVRAPAAPLSTLLPRGVDLHPGEAVAAVARPASPVAGLRAVLVLDRSNPDQAAVAERIQLRLHRAGMGVELQRLARDEHEAALSEGSYDLALVSFALLPEPGMALAQLVDFGAGRQAARDELRRVGAGAGRAERFAIAGTRAAKLLRALPLMPLYEQCPALVATGEVVGAAHDGAGVPTAADVWLAPPPAAELPR